MAKFDPKPFIASLTTQPGVYQMLNSKGGVIYVGKAKNLKRRVSSYFSSRQHDDKTVLMLSFVASIHTTVTQSENEALILENILIKTHKPKYNVLLKDNKGYPELWLSHAEFPQLSLHRGPHVKKGDYFGPYPSKHACRQTLLLIQKIFQLRQCDDVFFSHRTRPCLQYQIKRCTAPCVGKISSQDYQKTVADAKLFLQGHSQQVTRKIQQKMMACSSRLEYEQARIFRDQLQMIRSIQNQQDVSVGSGDVDVFAGIIHEWQLFVEIMLIRDGRLVGHRSFNSPVTLTADVSSCLSDFVSQFYLNSSLAGRPKVIYTNEQLKEASWLASVLSEQWGRRVSIRRGRQGQAKRWIEMATRNAQHACQQSSSSKIDWHQRCVALQNFLGLDRMPEKVICLDISHHRGEATYGSCVACGSSGLMKSHYRAFRIRAVEAGDDYAAIRQTLERYFGLALSQPDVVLIDGGKGQIARAHEVLEEQGLSHLTLISLAKGRSRQVGKEQLLVGRAGEVKEYDPRDDAMKLLWQLRDESHRFAIKHHRQKKRKNRQQSVLELIPGIGAVKRRELLQFFGGIEAIESASIRQLSQVPGISQHLAKTIHSAFHGDLPDV